MWAWFKTCLILFTTWFTRLPTTPTLLFYSGESVLFCVHGKVSDCCSNYYFLLGKMSTLAILSNGKLRAETVSLFLDGGFNSNVSSIPLSQKCSSLDCFRNMSLHVTKIETPTLFLCNLASAQLHPSCTWQKIWSNRWCYIVIVSLKWQRVMPKFTLHIIWWMCDIFLSSLARHLLRRSETK